MNEFILFGFEIVVALATSFIVLLYIGKMLRNILIEICGTAERAGFWMGFTKLTFVLLPLFIVVFYGSSNVCEFNLVPMARSILSRLMFGELLTLSIIGFVLWRTIANKNRPVQSKEVKDETKDVKEASI